MTTEEIQHAVRGLLRLLEDSAASGNDALDALSLALDRIALGMHSVAYQFDERDLGARGRLPSALGGAPSLPSALSPSLARGALRPRRGVQQDGDRLQEARSQNGRWAAGEQT